MAFVKENRWNIEYVFKKKKKKKDYPALNIINRT